MPSDHYNGVLDSYGLGFKVDSIPFQAQNLTTPQAVKQREQDNHFEGVAFGNFQKLLNLLLVVVLCPRIPLFFR
jgi:hypothetical protein